MPKTAKKVWFAIGTILLLFAVFVVYLISRYQPTPAEDIRWGLSFSHRHVEWLGFDWRTAYLDMLNDLKPQRIRIMTYWETLEPEPGKYNFSEPAEMLTEAQKRGIDVILVVGLKQPRWPECHYPSWYKSLSSEQQEQALLTMVENTVNYYKQFEAIKIWQVENEPRFAFGPDCPKTPEPLLVKEVELVRSLDPRPIMLSDSGEFGRWIPVAKLKPELLGSTMYRVVHNPKFGYFKYPLPPAFFKAKAGLVDLFTDIRSDQIIGVELQAEPWFSADALRTDLKTQASLMNPKIFDEYVAYAESVGFRENYLWGVEWWYWMAQKNGDWGMWDRAKQLLARERE